MLSMPAWLLGQPKIGVGLLALAAGFHLPFRLRIVRLVAVFVVVGMAAAMATGFAYLFAWTETESEGGMARVAAVSLLAGIAPIGITFLVFIFDCVSELEQPHRRQAR